MTEENDKTRIKSSLQNSQHDGGDDKTRIAPSGGADVSQKNPALEARRREAAQKKAKELEKRLAAIAAKKAKIAAASETLPESKPSLEPAQGGDKTQFQPRRQANTPVDDKTQIMPAISEPGDATQLAPKRMLEDHVPDKTVFNPVNLEHEPTKISDSNLDIKAEVSQPVSSGGAIHVDREQYIQNGQELLKNRFVFDKVLGAGGMGVVYKAKDLLKVEAQDRDPYVAIKVLGDEFKSHPEAFIALQRESRKTQRIAHPNIVNVHDFDRDGDTVFMTMEFLEGKPLDKTISQYRSTGLPEEDAWKILEGISAALIYAHEQHIIHSDFKPGNIFVTSSGNAKVFDFGIARAVAKAEKLEESVDDKTVFDAGNLGALTPAYASLEMLEGETPDVRDDIYALGCIAYEMFTGNHPFNRVHANEAMRQKLKPKRIPNITKSQWKAIEKALAFKREDRVETVQEFWRMLTHKRSSTVAIVSAVIVLVGIASVFGYREFLAPKENTVDTEVVRSEIQREFQIEQNKTDLAELLTSLEFTSSWERKAWEAFQSIQSLLGGEDVYVVEQKSALYNAYITKINAEISEENFELARTLLENAARYTDDQTPLAEILSSIEAAEIELAKRLEDEKKQQALVAEKIRHSAQQAKVQKEKNVAYDVALATVNKQLQCRSSMNMRDVDIAVSKLRSLNISRYRKQEEELVAKLSLCISKIGRSFPERAEEFKKRAIRIFPKNAVVAAIKIEPKDPCDNSLAGLGARGKRAICRDPLKDEGTDIGKGPSLVVIPKRGSVDTFAISKYEITVAQVNKFCSKSEKCSPIESGNGKFPRTDIDKGLIKNYLDWLSQMSKRKYRLPTKAEWVYASRANSSKKDSNRNCRLDSRGIKKGGVLIKASTGQQNAWGLVNYLGNARELVADGGSYAAMGGSFETAMQECVVTKAERHDGRADNLTGFRVLREIDVKN